MKEIELKPCPFCGNKNIEVVVDSATYSLGLYDTDCEVSFSIMCSVSSCGCGSSSGWHDSRESAINAWNRRADNEQREAD